MTPTPTVTDLGPTRSAIKLWCVSGKLHVVVAVKASFALEPGGPMKLAEPVAVAEDELVPYLPDAEIGFVGSAYPQERGASVRLALFADAALGRARIDRRVVVPGSPGALPALPCPALAPVAASAAERRALLGESAARKLGEPVPCIDEDFDWDYFYSVPGEQRCAHLAGDEWLLLEGLLRGHPRLVTQLPAARGFVAVSLPTAVGGPLPLAVRADMLRIDGEAGRCSVIWRGAFSVEQAGAGPQAQLWADVLVAGKAQMPLPASVGELGPSLLPACAEKALARAAAARRSRAGAPPNPTHPFAPPAAPYLAPAVGRPQALPAVPAWVTPRPAGPPSPWAAAPPGAEPASHESTVDLPAPAQLSAGGRPSTPFVPDVAGGGQPDFESTITLDGLAQAAVAARGATPFAQAARRPAAVPSPPAARPPHDFESTVELGEEDIVALSARELRAGGAAGSRAPGQPAPTEPAVPDFESTVALDPDELPPAPGRPAPPGRRG